MNNKFQAGIFGVAISALAGCALMPSTAQRAITTGLGAAAGGAAGYGLGGKKPGWTIAGAGVGALAGGLLLGSDPKVREDGFDDGYVQGQADSIKRQYFLRQSLEARPLVSDGEEEKTVRYVVPGPVVTVDGRKLEPHTVTLNVTE